MERWYLIIECYRRLGVLQRAHLDWVQDRNNLTKKRDYDEAWSDWQAMRWALDNQPDAACGDRQEKAIA